MTTSTYCPQILLISTNLSHAHILENIREVPKTCLQNAKNDYVAFNGFDKLFYTKETVLNADTTDSLIYSTSHDIYSKTVCVNLLD